MIFKRIKEVREKLGFSRQDEFAETIGISFRTYQTYEQGSDYDVDKNNNLGVALTDDGVYPAWSLFWDYNDLETSKKLPLPDPEIIYGENRGVFV